MKFISLLITTILFVSCKTSQFNRTVKINIMSTSDYCGGANPNDELIEELNTPKPFNGTIYIHKDPERRDKAITKRFVNGKATISTRIMGITDLGLFQYPAINLKKIENNESGAIMKNDCRIEKNFQPLGMIIVDPETKEVSLDIHLTCDPCSEPMP